MFKIAVALLILAFSLYPARILSRIIQDRFQIEGDGARWTISVICYLLIAVGLLSLVA